ncbi:5707_t:CDS:1, partial [Ambispora gerdemannii]
MTEIRLRKTATGTRRNESDREIYRTPSKQTRKHQHIICNAYHTALRRKNLRE